MGKVQNIKLIVSDIDGVWTDGSFYYSEKGDSFRKFSTKDSYGVALAKIAEIPVLILSGEKNKMVQARMDKLKVTEVALGITNKVEFLNSYVDKNRIQFSEVAFLGDDMNDFGLAEKVGFFACPNDAYYLLKQKADKVLNSNGGSGVFREFVEYILQERDLLEKTYQQYLKIK